MGQMGIFRSLGTTVSGVLALGFATVFMQEVSIDKSASKQNEVLAASFTLALLQALALLFIGIFFTKPLATWLIQPSATVQDLIHLRVVLAMSWVLIQIQNTIAILRGLGDIKSLSRTQVLISVTTLALMFPLVKLGSLGLALNVGAASLIAFLFSLFYLLKKNPIVLNRDFLILGYHSLRKTSRTSLIVTWQTIAVSGGFLAFQTLIQKSSSLDFLGNFAAAYMILDTSTNVLMASVRGYFLPQFGDIANETHKPLLLGKMIELLLLLATFGIVCICLFCPLVIKLLFSKQFETAPTILVVLSASLLGAVYSWSYNTLLMHKKETALFTIADTVHMGSLILGTYLSYYFHWHSLTPIFFYTLASFLSVLLYISVSVRKFGKAYLPASSFSVALQCFGIVTIAVLGFFEASWPLKTLSLIAIITLGAYRSVFREKRIAVKTS